jgi:hypothetical protein
MLFAVLLGLGGLCVLAIAAGIAARIAFYRRLTIIERHLAMSTGPLPPRADLPRAVIELALRCGGSGEPPPHSIRIRQIGSMQQASGRAAMSFKARQRIAIGAPGFLWRADFGPFGLIHVADYFIGGTGGIEGRFLGALPFLRFSGRAAATKGEIMRYLAELPWSPDAILRNRALEWRALDDQTLCVAAGAGASRGEVRLLLGQDGLVAAVEADDRPRLEKGSAVEMPWRGRFWDYREIEGRKIPMRGEVSWLLNEGETTYWRGTVQHWTAERPA